MIYKKNVVYIILIYFINIIIVSAMTLEQLKALRAVVEHGGFRAASEALFKSQSAISIAIRKLEGELNLALFTRDKYRPILTNEGKALYKKATVILNHSAEFTQLAEQFSMGEEPELRIAISGITPIEHILDVFKQTSEQSPSTQLSLQIENLNGTMERLQDGDADMAISENADNNSDYEYQHLTQVELISVVSTQSPLAKFSISLQERDLEGSTQIIVRDTSLHTPKLTAGIVEGTNRWVVNDFMMKKRVIASGSGWGRLPKHMVQKDIKKGLLIAISSSGFPTINIDLKAIRHKHKAIGPVAEALWQRLQCIKWT